MFKNMSEKQEDNDNYGDSADSLEQSSLTPPETYLEGNNLTITIPKFDQNVFLKYDYDQLLRRKLDTLGVPCEENVENVGNSKNLSRNLINFKENSKKFYSNCEENRSQSKKEIVLFKKLKDFVKLKVTTLEFSLNKL